MKSGTPFNTLMGYVRLVISSSYASDARFHGAAMSVRTFLMMHMGCSTDTNFSTNERLPKRSRPKTAAPQHVTNCAETFDASRTDFFTRKSEIALAIEQCPLRRDKSVANDNGGHAFG